MSKSPSIRKGPPRCQFTDHVAGLITPFEDANFVGLTSKTNSGTFSPFLPIRVRLLKSVEINVVNGGNDSVTTCEKSNPPTTAKPRPRRDSAPAPTPSAMGKVPIRAAALDIDLLLRVRARERKTIDRIKDLLVVSLDYERSNTDSFRYENNIDRNVVQLDLLADLPRTRQPGD